MSTQTHGKTKRELQAEAMKKSFIANAIPFLVEFYHKTKAGYAKFPASDLCVKHNLQPDIVPAMIDLRVIKTNGPVVSRHYFWSATHLAPTTTHLKNDLAEKLYHKVQDKRRVYQANKKLEEMHNDRVKAKGLTPIIGSNKPAKVETSKNVLVYRALEALWFKMPSAEYPKRRDILDEAVIDELGKELYETLGKQVIQAVLATNIIVPTASGAFSHPQLFYWKEAKPDETTVEFVVEFMSETKNGAKRDGRGAHMEDAKRDRCERIFKYIQLLYNNRHDHNRFKYARTQGVKEFRLTKNTETVVNKTVLFGGKWMGPAPTKELAEQINEKVSQYQAGFDKKKSVQTTDTVTHKPEVDKVVVDISTTPPKPATELQEACDMVAKLELRRKELLDKVKEVDESIEMGKQIIVNLQNQAFKAKFENIMAK